jgi:uncharacterized membrane protein
MFCIVVSHYSTSYILIFILLLTWIQGQTLAKLSLWRRVIYAERGRTITSIFPKITHPSGDNAAISKTFYFESPLNLIVNISVIALFFITLFVWYSQVTGVVFSSSIMFIEDSILSLNNLFILESRSSTVMSAFGQDENFRSLLVGKLTVVLYWISIALIAIGVFYVLSGYKRILSAFSGNEVPGNLSEKIDTEFFLLSLSCCIMLVISIVVPAISTDYSMNRQYIFSMVLLSLFFVIGSATVSKYLRLKPQWFLSIVLVLYFLCTSGALYQVTGVPTALTLNSEGFEYNMYYISDGDSDAAKWLGNHRANNITIYGDRFVARWLLSQAGIQNGVDKSMLLLEKGKEIDGYIYLRSHNVIDGMLTNKSAEDCSIGEYKEKFIKKFKCYNCGEAEVWL